MKTPAELQPLIDDGVIDEVLRSLKSGKEATVYLVRSGARTHCAKVYRNMAQRYFDGVLLMELVADADGNPAPRLSEVELSAETAREYHRFLIRQVVRMLCVGLIHGDLSEFNVLVAPDGPVIIDLPQVVNAAGNNAALAMLERDVNNLRSTLSRFAPELLGTEFAREMWDLYEQGELRPETELTGVFAADETVVDPDDVMLVIDDAREEEIQRRLRLVSQPLAGP
jgi:RIO kinase 1